MVAEADGADHLEAVVDADGGVVVIERSGDLRGGRPIVASRSSGFRRLHCSVRAIGIGGDAGLDLSRDRRVPSWRRPALSAGGEPVPAAMGQTGDRAGSVPSPAAYTPRTLVRRFPSVRIPVVRELISEYLASAVAGPAPAATMTWPWDGVSNPLPSTRSGWRW